MSTLEGSDALHPGWEPLLEWLAQHGMNVNREHLAVECRASTGKRTNPFSFGEGLCALD